MQASSGPAGGSVGHMEGERMCSFGERVVEFWADESGISSVEYALLLSIAGTGIMMGAELLGDAVSDRMIEIAGCFDGAQHANGGNGGGTGGANGTGNGAGKGRGFIGC